MASDGSASPLFMKIKSSESSFQFEVEHSKSKDLPVGQCVSSPKFTAGGYDWVLEYYPQGDSHENQSHVSLFLHLQSEAKDVNVKYGFKLFAKSGVTIWRGDTDIFSGYGDSWGYKRVISTNDLYCEKDSVVISCDIGVLSEQKVVMNCPGGLLNHIEMLWKTGERFDVTFEVAGESISAHKLILAARSSVFQAELFGPMAEAKMECIKIDDMKAEVFKALVHFIYTDELALDESSEDKTLYVGLLQDVLVAADRYALENLTLLCEDELVKKLSVDTVITTLVLAERHSCIGLKEKCLEFASDPENFFLVALTEGYLHVMSGYPSLVAELSEMVKSSSKSAKRQRTS